MFGWMLKSESPAVLPDEYSVKEHAILPAFTSSAIKPPLQTDFFMYWYL